MKWTNLMALPPYPFFSKQLRKDTEQLRADVEQALANRAKLEEEREKRRETDIAEVNFDDLVMLQSQRAAVLTLLQGELKIRERIATLAAAIQTEAMAAIDETSAALETATAEVRASLSAIGYPDPPAAGTLDVVQPAMLWIHPRIRELRGRLSELRSWANDHEHEVINRTAIEQITRQLTAARDAV